MPVIEDSVTIDRSREDVFRFVTEPSNTPLYNSAALEAEALTPTIEKGARLRGITRVAGKRIDWTAEVTEHHFPDRYAIRSTEAPVDFEIHWQFEELGTKRCKLTFHQESPDLKGFFGKLGDGVVTRMYSRDVRSNLENLKELMENG